ncbi:MAG: MoaD/ThiS family protein [Candidatus Bathyarchaeales archaeon]
MARVKVMFQAMFREIAGNREIIQEINNGHTLRDLLDILAKNYGRDFNDIVDPKTGEISTEVWVLVNGKSVRKTDIALNNDDVVYIGVPIGGG